MVALQTDQIGLAFRTTMGPVTDILHTRMQGPIENASKLELALALCKIGWKPALHLGTPHSKDSAKVFSLSMVPRSSLYFACLLDSARIWTAIDILIHPDMPHEYYLLILKKPETPQLALGIDELIKFGNKHFMAIRNGKELPALPSLGDKLVADPDPIEDGVAVALPEYDYEEIDTAADMELSALRFIEQGDNTVEFGTALHDSKHIGCGVRVVALLTVPRVYTACSNDDHAGCFRYRTLHQFADDQQALVYMVAWRNASHLLSRAAHVHAFEPSASDLEEARVVN